MKAVSVIVLAIAAVLGLVVADYGYGYNDVSYVPAYGLGGAGYGGYGGFGGGFGGNNSLLYLLGFLVFFTLLLQLFSNNNGVSNVTING